MIHLLKPLPLLLILFSSVALAQNKPNGQFQPAPEIQALIDQGNAGLDKADWQMALQVFEKARVLAQQRKDLVGEADALRGIGDVYMSTVQAEKALRAFQQSLMLARQIGDQANEAMLLNNMGSVYQRMAQYSQALGLYRQSLSLYQRMQNKPREAILFVNIGNTYALMGNFPKALEFLQRTLPLLRETGEKNREANLLTNIGSTYASMGQPDKALKFFMDALALRRTGEELPAEAVTLSNLGLAYRDLGQYPKALEYYDQALTLARKLGLANNEANVLYNIGSVHSLMGNLHQAEVFFERSLVLREQIRAGIGGSAGNRQAYLTSVLPTYIRLTTAQMDLNEGERAFATVNKMKGRTLLEQTANRTTLVGVPSEAQQHLQELRQQNDKLSVQLAAARGKNEKQEAELREHLEQTERELDKEQDRLFSLYSGAAQRNVTRTLTVADISSFLPADTALLEFASLIVKVGKEKINRLMLFVVTANGGMSAVTIHPIVAGNDAVGEMTERLREACANPKQNEKPLARKLGAMLLPPDVMARLAGKTRLVICPDGDVWNVPFAALLLPDGKRLLESYEIDYAYSATGADAALKVPRHSPEKQLLILANPDFGDTSRFGDTLPDQIAKGKERPISEPARPLAEPARPLFDPARLASIVDRGKIKPLPGTQVEADAIHKLYPNATLITGKAAQEAELAAMLPTFRYLHFATHGLLSDAAPLQSAIVLAAPPKGSDEDGFLTAREIYEMNLNAEMVVLSACETARGEVQSGEGVIGLTWALFAAGVPTQVVSQWKVSDASTPELMEKFYGNLKAGQGKGKALRNAALTMMKDKAYHHPYHWASFVLFGDWR